MAYVIATGVAAARAIDDSSLPDTAGAAMITSLIEGSDLVENILDATAKSFSSRMDKFFRWGLKGEGSRCLDYRRGARLDSDFIPWDGANYTHDVPTVLAYWNRIYDNYLKGPSSIPWSKSEMSKYRVGSFGYYLPRANLYTCAMARIQKDFKLDFNTGSLTIPGLVAPKLYGMTLSLNSNFMYNTIQRDLVPTAKVYAEACPTHTRNFDITRHNSEAITLRNTGVSNPICIYTVEHLVSGVPTLSVYSFDMEELNEMFGYEIAYICAFLENTETNKLRYVEIKADIADPYLLAESDYYGWPMDYSDDWVGTSVNRDFIPCSGFFPRIYLRLDKKFLDHPSFDPKLFKDSKYALKKFLNIKIDQLTEEIAKNPDIGDIDSCALHVGVRIATSDPLEQAYINLHKQKYSLNSINKFTYNDHYNELVDEGYQSPLGILIDNAWGDSLRWLGEKYNTYYSGAIIVNKVIGPVGSVSHDTSPYQNSAGEWFSTVRYYTQITPTTCRVDPTAGYQSRFGTDLNVNAYSDEDADEAIVPIDLYLLEQLIPSNKEREKFLAKNLYYVFTASQKIKVKWYQSGLFQLFVQLFSIVITIWALGPLIGSVSTALATGATVAIKAAIFAIVKTIVITVALNYGLQFVAAVLGSDLSFLIAIVAIAIVALGGAIEGNIKNLPWAKDLLMLSTNLGKAANIAITNELVDIQKEYDILYKEQTDFDKELEEIFSVLNTNSNLLSPMSIIGESAERFYNRTIHTGNIGILSIDAVRGYVDNMIKLPEITDTIGVKTDGWIK